MSAGEAGRAAEPYRVACAEIWGGVEPLDLDICTRGVTASVHSTASGGLRGGDIYYLSVCSADLLTRIAIADVQGHGEQVSSVSTWLYRCLQDKMNSLDGAGVLADLNAIVHGKGFGAFTTAAIMSYKVGDSTLYYSYAGHPPLLARRSGGRWSPLELETSVAPADLPLGMMPNVHYNQSSVPVKTGDRIFLYTDGLSESPGETEDDLLGDDRLITLLEQTSDLTAAAQRSAVIEHVTSRCGGSLLHDDCTCMVIEIH